MSVEKVKALLDATPDTYVHVPAGVLAEAAKEAGITQPGTFGAHAIAVAKFDPERRMMIDRNLHVKPLLDAAAAKTTVPPKEPPTDGKPGTDH